MHNNNVQYNVNRQMQVCKLHLTQKHTDTPPPPPTHTHPHTLLLDTVDEVVFCSIRL